MNSVLVVERLIRTSVRVLLAVAAVVPSTSEAAVAATASPPQPMADRFIVPPSPRRVVRLGHDARWQGLGGASALAPDQS
jgi:hypothetical protein